MAHPFTEFVVKLMFDDSARNAYFNTGTVPHGCGPISPAQEAILRPAGPDQSRTSAAALNDAIHHECARTTAAGATAGGSPQTIRIPAPNWPSRP